MAEFIFQFEDLCAYFLIPKTKLVIKHSLRLTFLLLRWLLTFLYREIKMWWLTYRKNILHKLGVVLGYFILLIVVLFLVFGLPYLLEHLDHITDLLVD